jgi:hypothetical protein
MARLTEQKLSGLLGTFGKYGGFGGLILFVFFTLFSRIPFPAALFSQVSAEETYKLLALFMILTFILCIVGLGLWGYVRLKENPRNKTTVISGVALAFSLGGGALLYNSFFGSYPSHGDDRPPSAVSHGQIKPTEATPNSIPVGDEQPQIIVEPPEPWTSENEPPGRIVPQRGTCPEGYKPIDHMSGPGGYVRHIDCVPGSSRVPAPSKSPP